MSVYCTRFSLVPTDLDVVSVIAVTVPWLAAMFKSIRSIGWASVRFGRLKALYRWHTRNTQRSTYLHLHNQTIRTFY